MTRSFSRFLIVGAAGFIVDSGMTLAISYVGVSPILARAPAIAMAILTTWLMNRRFTFDVKTEKSVSEAARYVTVALSSAFLNFLLYCLLVKAGIWPAAAIAVATGVLAVVSFYAYRCIAFSKK
jgi:putative flippase GtrA